MDHILPFFTLQLHHVYAKILLYAVATNYQLRSVLHLLMELATIYHYIRHFMTVKVMASWVLRSISNSILRSNLHGSKFTEVANFSGVHSMP